MTGAAQTEAAQTATAPLHVIRPAIPATAGVIVIQEAFGVTDHIMAVAQRLADAGYLAVVPELFWRAGSPVFDPAQGFEKIGPVMGALKAGEIAEDVDVAQAALEVEGIPASRTGLVGFCMGGSIALATAVDREIGACVTFYGGGLSASRFGYPPLLEVAAGLRTPWLGLFGDQDQGIPSDEVELLRTAAAHADVPSEVVRYPEAGHGFHNDTRADVYAAGAAVDAWGRTMEFFARHLQ